ncbi:MAG TPA: adenylate/guanylate cyclase domain-containing protein [Thermoanaerobaculia bacterium]|nr:adenylate/guanylate cyclase domain-containing protein [Thermoanaerobaculia bacterium]
MTTRDFNSLEDFLKSQRLTIDGLGEDGWGGSFPVKGREIEATILFADISNFSGHTSTLSSTETLAYVNLFFSWISAEGLSGTSGIVDKYIGDEIMIVFSREFGSSDAFAEALSAARGFGERDAFSFSPHIGIASGVVTVGYVGTPFKYDCSVFGRPVATAARCAAVKPEVAAAVSMVFPAAEWGHRNFRELFPSEKSKQPDGSYRETSSSWEMRPPRTVSPKNMDPLQVISVEKTSVWIPMMITAEDWARKTVTALERKARTSE